MLKNFDDIKDSLLICEKCHESNNIPKDLKKEDFTKSNLLTIINPLESKHK